jgi:hypothetical protein
MASTYSPLKIELIGTGDQSGTWGVTTNTNLGTAIEEAITGTADVSFSSADVTLTLTNTNTAQTARNLRLNLTGTVAAAQNLIVPSIEKQYIVNNGLTFDITVKNATGTGVAVPAGKSMIVFNTGSNVVEVTTALATGTVIPVANGGTGATSQTAYSVICGGTTSTGAYQSVISLGTAGQVLTSNGAGALPTWGAASAGTVTSVGWTGGIVSVATATTTPAFTIAGTSGGIPYFSSGTTWASSGVLAASALVIGGGAGAAPSTTTTGTGVITALGVAANGSGGFVTDTGTVTLTNKRITSRSLAAASATGTVTPKSDLYDQVNYLLTGTVAFAVPSGTPTNGQKLSIRLYAASTQTVSWTTTAGGYRVIGTTLPLSVASTKTVYVGCVYNSTDAFWDVVAVAEQS